MQEQFLLKTYRTGTTMCFFDTHLKPDNVTIFPAYVFLDQQGNPIKIITFDKQLIWQEPFTNYYVDINEAGYNYITGGTKKDQLTYVISDVQKNKIDQKWKFSMQALFSGASTSYTKFYDVQIDDLNIDVNLYRSYATLDTLSVYNNMVNSFPVQESETGTVFGRLIATQKVKDANNNNIKIPLKNVPIGIFNPTDVFQSPTDSDENGNRLTLNLKEASFENEYFNFNSYSSDTTNYLISGSGFTVVPDEYRFVTRTNDEGEFVIHNVPIGTQTVFFEVDLFKQGLTKDEIALNFFSFPADDIPNIAEIPSLFFRQFSIDVVPNWGTSQTGYTELNIRANLDLRKWATFYIEEVAFNNKNFEELQQNGFFTPISIEFRNMARDGYPKDKIQVVEIPSMIDRDPEQVLLWNNEFVQLTNKAQFFESGYHAFKLPANMYDPIGNKTDLNGNPMNSKGVWLAGYQMSYYYGDKLQLFRNTGQKKIISNDNVVTRDHFNLNFNSDDNTSSNVTAVGAIGNFPYEKKWDHLYPEKYSIPKSPTVPNPLFYTTNDLGKRILERPKWLDGDLIGVPFELFRDSDNQYGGTGGYGAALDNTNGDWFKTNFSKFVTKNLIFKYENTGSFHEFYGNGYMPNNPEFPIDAGASRVVGGEKYQRVECGYGYWLRPEGWPRISHHPVVGDSDSIYKFDTTLANRAVSPSDTNQTSENIFSVNTYTNSISFISTLAGKKLYLNLGNESKIQEGRLDIYRVVDPGPNNLNSPNPSVIPTFIRLYFLDMYSQRGRPTNVGGIGGRLSMIVDNDTGSLSGGGSRFWRNNEGYGYLTLNDIKLHIRNVGVIPVDIQGVRLMPGSSYDFLGVELSNGGTFDNLILDLPGNADFDYTAFKYTRGRYEMQWRNIRLYNGSGNQEGDSHSRDIDLVDWPANQLSQIPQYYLQTRCTNVTVFCYLGADNGVNSIKADGMIFVNPDNPFGGWYDSYFATSKISVDCPVGIPIQVEELGS